MVRGQTGGADGLAGVVMACAGLWFARVGGVEACLLVEAFLFCLVGELVIGGGGGGSASGVFVLLGGDGVGGVVCVVDRGVLVEDLFEGIHILFCFGLGVELFRTAELMWEMQAGQGRGGCLSTISILRHLPPPPSKVTSPRGGLSYHVTRIHFRLVFSTSGSSFSAKLGEDDVVRGRGASPLVLNFRFGKVLERCCM